MGSANVDRNSSKTYNLTWSGFSSSLTTTAQNLRINDDLTDITISAGGKIFTAHKLVLSAASPLLKELLRVMRHSLKYFISFKVMLNLRIIIM